MIKYLDLKAVNSPYDEEIRSAVSRVLDSGWYLKGEATRRAPVIVSVAATALMR